MGVTARQQRADAAASTIAGEWETGVGVVLGSRCARSMEHYMEELDLGQAD
jgi:hypothetical protein